MRRIVLPTRQFLISALALTAAVLVTLHPQALSAKTPDGLPPSQEIVCSGLTGAAFGLCNAYCEAQDCDVHPRPSCAQLRRNFARVTGSDVFPCDLFCGDQVVTPPEECDPPGSMCGDGGTCTDDCTCQQPACGDGMVDRGEECDPPGSTCGDGGTCTDDCTCRTPACGDGMVDPGEECDPPGSLCMNERPCNNECQCAGPPSLVCCQCGAAAPTCFNTMNPDQCSIENCAAMPGSCGDNGVCVP